MLFPKRTEIMNPRYFSSGNYPQTVDALVETEDDNFIDFWYFQRGLCNYNGAVNEE